MPRSISIDKVGGSTIVKQWNKADLSDTITKVYNMPVNYTKERNTIVIDASGDHNRLVLLYDEIVMPVAVDFNDLVDVFIAGNYFK